MFPFLCIYHQFGFRLWLQWKMSKIIICSFYTLSCFTASKCIVSTSLTQNFFFFFTHVCVNAPHMCGLNFLIHIPVRLVSVALAGGSRDRAQTEQTRHAHSTGLQCLQFRQMSTFFIRNSNIVRQNSSLLKYTNKSIK